MNAALTAGFADPVRGAQACFRAILDAMSRPGRIHAVSGVTPPEPLCAAAAAVLLTLADQETPLWLAPDVGAARGWIAFHCAAPLATDPMLGIFALSLGVPDLTRFAAGTHEAPETSATVIAQLPALTGGPALRLAGPGLRDSAVLAPVGLPADFVTLWRRNQMLFPGGIDLILCAGQALTALPRSVSIRKD